jgi:inhibitor of KinA
MRNMHVIEITPLGDAAVLVRLGDSIDPATHLKVRQLSAYLDRHPFVGMVEYIPTFTTVTVFYDGLQLYRRYASQSDEEQSVIPYDIAVRIIEEIITKLENAVHSEKRIVEIPVCYGGEFGPDLDEVASRNRLTPKEVIEIHTSADYLVYMVGFAPGFPYLGGMDKRIAAPRRQTARLSIPKGTVGIAGEQTGVYPIETPGGWQLIGRTPTPLFLPEQMPPTLLQSGNIVRFYPISRSEYDRWEGRE